MASDVQIANRALRRLGANTIVSFDEQTAEGRLVNETYSEIRDSLIRSTPWNFATRRASIAAAVDAPTWGFTTAFSPPADFLRLLEVDGESSKDTVKVEHTDDGTVIVTDLPAPLKIRYIARVINPDLMDPGFRKALAYACAVEWAEPITGTKSVYEMVAQEALMVLREAKSEDGQEGSPDAFVINTWLNART